MNAPKRRGRPTKTPDAGERVPLGLRVTAATKELLDDAAQESGRSQSQEAELRLERSFERASLLSESLETAYGPELAGVLKMLGSAMSGAGPTAASSAAFMRGELTLQSSHSWMDDPYAFDQAVRAASSILEALRPAGEAQAPAALLAGLGEAMGDETTRKAIDQLDANLGDRFAATVINAVKGEGASRTLQRDAVEIRKLLGPLADRLHKGGKRNAR